jgi:hypothetical protein
MGILESPFLPKDDKPAPTQSDPITPPWYDHQPLPSESVGGVGGGTSGGSGTGGGTGTGTTISTGSGRTVQDYNDTDKNARFLGVGGHPEVWKDSTTGQIFLVYFAAGTEPPVPLLYEVPDTEALQAFFGAGNKIIYDRTMSNTEMTSTGSVRFGSSNNIVASEGDPWLGFLDRVERLKEISAWVNDDEILALMGAAYLENRELKDWEIKTTDWWRNHTPEERSWMEMQLSDPAQAERKLSDDRLYVRGLFEAIGAEGNDPALLEWMSNQYSTGKWSSTYLVSQVEAVTSGYGDVDQGLSTWMSDKGLKAESSEQHYGRVQELWNKWLGPAYQPSQSQITEWATKIRNSEDGEDSLIEMLRAQRLALFPEYSDPSLTWKDISAPWTNMAYNAWGVQIDESDPFLQELVRLNDANNAQKLLRGKGFERGYDQVVNQMTRGVRIGMGNNVRGVV